MNMYTSQQVQLTIIDVSNNFEAVCQIYTNNVPRIGDMLVVPNAAATDDGTIPPGKELRVVAITRDYVAGIGYLENPICVMERVRVECSKPLP